MAQAIIEQTPPDLQFSVLSDNHDDWFAAQVRKGLDDERAGRVVDDATAEELALARRHSLLACQYPRY